jgi:hypothetical protein
MFLAKYAKVSERTQRRDMRYVAHPYTQILTPYPLSRGEI